ncbi:MAG: hypothetical protein HOH13_01845 [Crocinitomicaceae bacterium]|nr:hypothetical protein [Crocinitomicaceae bacterium]MBT6029020.1 hypothetical protein [Crocinitomicaceae bacterium]
MKKYNLDSFIIVTCISLFTACVEPMVGDDSVLENPNAGEFGRAGENVSKEYNYLFEINEVDRLWFLSKLDTMHKESAQNYTLYDWTHSELSDSTKSLVMAGTPCSFVKSFESKDSVIIEFGYLFSSFVDAPKGFNIKELNSKRVVSVQLLGLVSENKQALTELDEFISDNDFAENGSRWYEYTNMLDSLIVDSTFTVIRQPIQ